MPRSSFLFVTWDGGGNVNPVLALGRQLLERGHVVRVLGSASLSERFARAGIDFVARDPATEWDQSATADDVLAECARVPTDALIVDYMQPGALCGAEASRLPTAAFVHTLYSGMLVNGDLPTMYMAATLDGVNSVRDRLGQPPLSRLAELLEGSARVVVTSPRELDAPLDSLPANVSYVGPVLESPAVEEWSGAQPEVVVSLGTTSMDEGVVLQRVLDAAADLPVRVLATVGDHLDPTDFAAPANVTVSRYVPHAAVLAGAQLLVCHAGLGGILAALSYGVPILCIPLGRDQPANAAAVERTGAGRSLPPDAPAQDIGAAMAALLEQDVTDMTGPIAAYGHAAVDALEALITSGG